MITGRSHRLGCQRSKIKVVIGQTAIGVWPWVFGKWREKTHQVLREDKGIDSKLFLRRNFQTDNRVHKGVISRWRGGCEERAGEEIGAPTALSQVSLRRLADNSC